MIAYLIRDILGGKFYDSGDGGWYTWEHVQNHRDKEDFFYYNTLEVANEACRLCSHNYPVEVVTVYI